MFKLNVEDSSQITDEIIIKLIDAHAEEVARIQRLKDYYAGKHGILNRPDEPNKPNNKLVANYAQYITDIIQGYFIGIPVEYSFKEDSIKDQIEPILIYNDEQDENSELAKMLGISGRAYELLYIDLDKNIRFNEIDPQECFVIYDTSLVPEYLAAVRYYTIHDYVEEKDTVYVEFYTESSVKYYIKDGDKLQLENEEMTYFKDVPIVEYKNNEEMSGDFEGVMNLIDAYNLSISNKMNDIDYFTDAYLAIEGALNTEIDDIVKMRENRVWLLGEGQKTYFITKPSNNADVEAAIKRLNSDIHKFSMVVDLADQKFAGNSSGVAVSYKLFGLDQKVKNKERKFKTGLMRRLELIANHLNLKGGEIDYKLADVKFYRNTVEETDAQNLDTVDKNTSESETKEIEQNTEVVNNL